MRIVGGIWKGRVIRAPKGMATRPTSDRVREALFSSLESLMGSLEGAVVLDPFAGSGALGLEAISRGAARAVFVDKDTAAVRALNENVRSLSAEARVTVVRADAVRLGAARLGHEPFTLLLLDPPYRIDKAEVSGFISRLADSGLLAEDAVVVWEHAATDTVEWPGHVAAHATKRYGSTTVDIAVAERLEGER